MAEELTAIGQKTVRRRPRRCNYRNRLSGTEDVATQSHADPWASVPRSSLGRLI